MNKKYSQEELDQILLSKKLNEFYLAIIENRQELLSDEEYEEIIRKDKTIYGDNKEEVEDLINKVQTDEQLKNFAPDLMKVMFGLAQVRHLAILTMIDDDVYDIGSAKFENLKRNKIVHFDNLTTLYNESNARVRYFTPEEEPQLTQRTVLVDIDDESIIQAYENEHIHQEESEDLTNLSNKFSKKLIVFCNLEFFSLRSLISSSCLSIFFSSDLTLMFKASLFSVSILTFFLFPFNSVSTSLRVIDNLCIFYILY